MVQQGSFSAPVMGAARICLRAHAKQFGVELSRRAELSQWLEQFNGKTGLRGWILRLASLVKYRALVRDANFRTLPQDQARTVREATLLFLAPTFLANQLAVVFEQADKRRADRNQNTNEEE